LEERRLKDQRRWAEGIQIAARLRELALLLREVRVETREFSADLLRKQAEEFEVEDPTHRRAQSTVEELDALLKDMSFEVAVSRSHTLLPDSSRPHGLPPHLEAGEFWSLGSIDFHHDLREIHAGFVEPILRFPTKPLPERLVAFLFEIPGDKDFLTRERHDHFGWHYHYLDHKERRSNIILCWDTRIATPLRLHPLFCETHAEGTRDFVGRPDLWGLTKRSSMHGACSHDLGKWPLNEFKTPGRKAMAVWPLNAALTAMPVAAPATAPKFPSKKGAKGRRR
jgi:hypothetical protein